MDSVDVDTDYVFVFEDEEIAIEQFAEINQISVEQAKAMAEYCQRMAEDWLKEYFQDNPPGIDTTKEKPYQRVRLLL